MRFERFAQARACGFAAVLALSAPCAAMAQDADTLVVDNNFQLRTADPARQFEPTASLVLHPIYETLVTFEGSDLTEVVPSLAGLPDISDDAKTFTFKLADGATFSDGSPVEVKDVVWSLNRVRDLKGSPSFLMNGVTVEVGDNPGEVVMTTEQPDPGLPYKLTNPSLGILNSDVLMENGGTADATDGAEGFLAETSVGSGPYVLEKFDIASEVIISRRDDYWGDAQPTFDRIVIRNAESSAQQMNVARGASNIALDLRPDQIASVADRVDAVTAAGADVSFLFVNANPDVTEVGANPDFREAVRYGIDYDGILNLVGEGATRPGSVIPSMFGGALDASRAPSRDLERAKAALERSGIEDPTIHIGYASDLAKHGIAFADVAAKVQADLKEVGIDVVLEPAPVQTNSELYRSGALEMGIAWWGPDFPDPSNYLLFEPGKLVGLRAGWPDGAAPEVTEIGAKAATTTDQDERADLYQEWQMKMNEVSPFIGLFQPATSLVSTKELAPLAYNPMWTVDLSNVTLDAN